MAFDTAVKTLTEVGASEPLAVAVVDFARQAGTDAAGELGTRADFKEREASQPRSARFDGGDQPLWRSRLVQGVSPGFTPRPSLCR